jgi:putative ABC transport system permease protein
MSFTLATLWHDRQRYLPGVLAVAFSAVLIALQCGLLLGLLSVTALPIDNTRADIWVGGADVLSVDIATPIPSAWVSRVAEHPEVAMVEEYLQGFAKWKKASGGDELCIVIGSSLEDDAIGWVNVLTPQLRRLLTEPNTVVIDESERDRLGLATGIDETGEINGRKVRVVGLIRGYKSLAGPYVFCSQSTARPMLRLNPEQTTYLLAKCRDKEEAPVVVARLKPHGDMTAFTSQDFSVHSRIHWLTKTKAGIALGYSALLGLLVGAVVTSQTLYLYAAIAGALREYAVLRALGIPRWRMAFAVMEQSVWVGLAGIALALPTVYGLARIAEIFGAKVLLDWWLIGCVAAITLVMALFSGLFALRSLRLVEPANLLR